MKKPVPKGLRSILFHDVRDSFCKLSEVGDSSGNVHTLSKPYWFPLVCTLSLSKFLQADFKEVSYLEQAGASRLFHGSPQKPSATSSFSYSSHHPSPSGYAPTTPMPRQSGNDTPNLNTSLFAPWGSSGGESSSLDRQKGEDTWVTVFGFPSGATSYILNQFGALGTIDEHDIPGNGNWIHLHYQTPLQASKALSRNGRVLTNHIMVGVLRGRHPHPSMNQPMVNYYSPFTVQDLDYEARFSIAGCDTGDEWSGESCKQEQYTSEEDKPGFPSNGVCVGLVTPLHVRSHFLFSFL
ncbi:unnamed protein product [Darwinula stevensoni]|uniref:Nucleoporin NUP35 n=1 Tax=Darwinula stevensoni TaxID=69355 RepID=A0A7R9A7W2_9CRUS|nr:unnamed protein product [Darwinula stevensoni]CAG0893762.1 unnamed protein product [Darwinula stevensoni]